MRPIGKLLLTRIEEAGLTRHELIVRIGYQNSSKGLRRLNHLIGTGEDRAGLLPKLSEILEIPREDVNRSLQETHWEIAQEQGQADRAREAFERANFAPYLGIETDRIFPSPIHLAVIGFQALKRIPIPEDVSELPGEKRLEWIQLAVRENYRRTKGRLIAFGKITGYEYRVGFDRSIRFSTDGTLVRTNEVPSPTPIMSVKVRGRSELAPVVWTGKTGCLSGSAPCRFVDYAVVFYSVNGPWSPLVAGCPGSAQEGPAPGVERPQRAA